VEIYHTLVAVVVAVHRVMALEELVVAVLLLEQRLVQVLEHPILVAAVVLMAEMVVQES
jgi:hypothetical protein